MKSAPADYWFSDGATFLVPYTLVYLLFWKLHLPTASLLHAFWLLHGVTLGFFCFWAIGKRAQFSRKGVLIWGLLFLALFLPGAYLEFPSDPWEHFRRIYAWQSAPLVSDGSYPHKSGSFFFYSLIGWFPFEWGRLGMRLVSTGTQLLLLSQLRRLLKLFPATRDSIPLHLFAFLVLFGTNLHSYRYYALSTSILAYAAYLSLLTLWLRTPRESWPRLVMQSAGLVLVIALNHVQELLFVFLAAASLIGWRYSSRFFTRQRLAWFAAGAIASVAFGIFCRWHFPATYARMGIENVSRWGSFRIWRTHSVFLETWGIHGLLALVFSVFYFQALFPFSLLTLTPVFIYLFPPVVLVLARGLSGGYDAYRFIYLIPTSIALVLGLQQFWRKAGLRNALALGCVLSLAADPRYPWRGRLLFQFYPVPRLLALRPLDETALWFAKNRSLSSNCVFLADNTTQYYLTARFGLRHNIERLLTYPRLHDLFTPQLIAAQVGPETCGILVLKQPEAERFGAWPHSWVAKRSGHWIPGTGDIFAASSPEFEKTAQSLELQGWQRTEVPPFYFLLERRGRR